ncbi:hypothetical protein D9M69_466160 [compost metagenome]
MQLLAVETEAALRQRHDLPREQPVQGGQLLRAQLLLQMLVEIASQTGSFSPQPLHVLRHPVALAGNLIRASPLHSGHKRNLGLVGCTRVLDASLKRLAPVDQREPAIQLSLTMILALQHILSQQAAMPGGSPLPTVMLQLFFGLLDVRAGLLQVS